MLEVVILFNDLSNKVCIPNKTEDSSLHAFNMTTGINESKILTKDISYQCKGKFDGRKCNSDKKWDNNKRWCECKKHCICEKITFGILIVVKMKNIYQVLLMVIQWLSFILIS